MAVLEALTEEEAYLVALLQDSSGVDIAEFLWKDPDNSDNLFRCYDYQYAWYRNDSKQQIDQCVAEGELVLTRRGQVPIEHVRVGDEVWTHRNRWREVTYTWDKGVQEVVRVTNPGNNAGLLVTPDHKMWTRGGVRKMLAGVRSLRPTEPEFRAPQDFTVRSGEQYATMLASPWNFGCTSEVPQVERLPWCNRDTIPTIGDDFLWLCGIYVAEGTVRRSGNETVLSVHRDEAELIAKVATKIGLRPRIYDVDTQVRQVILPGRSLGVWFIEHFGKLAHGKKLPTWALSMPDSYRQALLDGLIFGDGHTRTTRRDHRGDPARTGDEYTTVSKMLAYDVRLLAQSLGRGASVNMARRAGVMQIQGRTVSTRDTYCVTLYVQESKKNRIALVDDHVWAAHYGAIPAGFAHVYDIEVEGDHSFVVNGQTVSNCARAIGKSVGIQMRGFAFPFCNPGNDMLITAPEMIHLDPVTKNIEDRLMSTRLSREMLKSGNQSSGITHRPFEAKFRNGAKIVGRIPQKDGKGVKGSLAGNTLITTPIGHLPVEKISEGDLVLTSEGRFMPVLKVFSYEADTVLAAGAGHRGIQVSTNHRFYARRNRNPQRTRNLEHPTWMSVDDEEYGRHYWASPVQMPYTPVPELPFDFLNEGAVFWLAGRYVADGNMTGRNRRNMSTGVMFTAHADRVEEIEGIARLAGFNPYRRAHQNAAATAIHSSRLAQWLLVEFGEHADGKRIPVWMHAVPRTLQDAFLEGYLTGDGHRDDVKGRWTASTASKELAIGLRLLGNQMGFTTGFSWVDVMPNDMCASPLRSHRVTFSERDRGVRDGHFVWQKIRSIEPAGPAIVYDLIVAEDASYVADGLVHRGGLI